MELKNLFAQAKAAARSLNLVGEQKVNEVLVDLAQAALQNTAYILSENQKDLDRMDKSDPKYDRLLLSEKRIADIAADILSVSKLPSPLDKTIDQRTRPNGLHITRITVPMGVVGVIYEARPNVTFDVFALCLKSGNVAVLKGGSDAEFSNKAIASVIQGVLRKHQLDPNIATLLPADRSATEALLAATDYVDVLIPRGSQNLINYVRDNAKVPVIETGAGIVHVYFAPSGNLAKGRDIVFNSKTRRVSVCNALDCLLVHHSRLADLGQLVAPLAQANVTLYADEAAHQALAGQYPAQLLQPAQAQHYGTEFLDYKMAIKTVADLSEALDHIARYSSKHSEAIVSEDTQELALFQKAVDAAVVYANVSTAFTDGAQFGLGAEIGISTQKLHARGPMALAELCSYKWVVQGNGQTRA